MSGKRVLDLAALVKACRGVAQKHVSLRARQLDVYNRTSTLARAVKSQTDRVTETVKAASFFASRLNESAPEWAKGTVEDEGRAGRPTKDGSPPRRETAKEPVSAGRREEADQSNFNERAEENYPSKKVSKSELDVKQAKADRYPLADVTIPPTHSDINLLEIDHALVSKQFLEEPQKNPFDNGEEPLSGEQRMAYQRPAELQIPYETADYLQKDATDPLEEGHDEDSFYRAPKHTSPSLSSLPKVKIPKYPSDVQDGGQINSDTFYHNRRKPEQIPSVQAIPDQEQLPQGVNTDLFYSPRIAKLLGGNPHTGHGEKNRQSYLELKGVQDTPIETTKLSVGKDQDTFYMLGSSQGILEKPAGSEYIPLEPPENAGTSKDDEIQELTRENSKPAIQGEGFGSTTPTTYELRESKVPSSRIGRLWNYGGLAAGMFGGVITESVRRVTGNGGEGSFMFSAGNMDRLVTKLSRMRGAALKLGQVISFQDSKLLPAPIQEVLQRVQDRADYMPPSQRDKVLASNLGSEWRGLFSSFEEKPLAAASIGQVHSAVLKSNGQKVAVKIQYPGVADSIDSDLDNLTLLLTASRLLPKGLFLDKTIANARIELAWECDYTREAACGNRFQELLADEKDTFLVPVVYPEASGKQVLTMEYMDGIGVTRVQSFTQKQKDWIGTQILRLCLREIIEFRFMQTDPNWTNFLYNAQTNKLELLDFGASREYPEEFITRYAKLLAAASKSDRETVRTLSIELGYLTGVESKAMLDAHIASILTLAEPFLESSPEVYDFKNQTITERVKALIPVMIRERLAPPPEETYSLHRKLSGAFLLCARLGSRVRCRELFERSMGKAGIL